MVGVRGFEPPAPVSDITDVADELGIRLTRKKKKGNRRAGKTHPGLVSLKSLTMIR